MSNEDISVSIDMLIDMTTRAETAEKIITNVQNIYDTMMHYRNNNALNFQLEKFDDYLKSMGNALKGGK